VMKHDPADPSWPDRDRFVLSNGHASILQYSMLYLNGYGLEMDDIKDFRQWESRTPGHPEARHTPGIEVTTGPLAQGFANAVGMAIAERVLAARFGSQAVDHHTYVIAGDGCFMEGVSHEAASLAGHLGLGKLICVYDDNHITIDGDTALANGAAGDSGWAHDNAETIASAEWQAAWNATGLPGWTDVLPTAEQGEKIPTRKAIESAINATLPYLPGLAAGAPAP